MKDLSPHAERSAGLVDNKKSTGRTARLSARKRNMDGMAVPNEEVGQIEYL